MAGVSFRPQSTARRRIAGSSEAALISSAAVETRPEKRVAKALSSSASSSWEKPRSGPPGTVRRNGVEAQPEKRGDEGGQEREGAKEVGEFHAVQLPIVGRWRAHGSRNITLPVVTS